MGRPSREAPMEHADADALRPGQRRRVLITGAGGQLGVALADAFAADDVRGAHARRLGRAASRRRHASQRPDLVLHAAAWTNVDGAEDDPQGAAEVNVGGTTPRRGARRAARRVLDRLRLRRPQGRAVRRVGQPAARSRPTGGRSSTARPPRARRAWVVRSSWLFGPTGHNFVRTMLRLGGERDEVAVVDDQRGCPTYVGHLAAATRELVDGGAPFGIWHLAAAGDCTWADFAEAIFDGGGARLPRPADHDRGVRRARPSPGDLGPAQREGRPGAPALARGPRRLPRRPRGVGGQRGAGLRPARAWRRPRGHGGCRSSAPAGPPRAAAAERAWRRPRSVTSGSTRA